MWNEPMPVWRTARKEFQCQGEGCTKVIAIGDRYLDQTLREPLHSHLRYCEPCGEPVMEGAKGYHIFRGQRDFADYYHRHVVSTYWKKLRLTIIDQRGSRCQHCGLESGSLGLHHLHYRSLGNEKPEDVELLCPECHPKADEARATKGRPRHALPEQVLIAGSDGDYWGKFEKDITYVPLPDGRYKPLETKKGKT